MSNQRTLEILDRVIPTISKLKGRKLCSRLISDMNKAAGMKCFTTVGRAIVFVTPKRRYVLYNGHDFIADYGTYGRIVGNDIFPALFEQLRKQIKLN